MSRSRAPAPSTPKLCRAKSSASWVTCQKSACRPIRLRSQVYWSCFARHSSAKGSQRSPRTSWARAAALDQSNSVPYASNTAARTSLIAPMALMILVHMDPGKPTVLVVDDEKNIRRTLRMVLEAEGLEVREAESAEEALPLIESEPVDLGLFDVRLPGMDGLTLLQKARELWRDLPVIVISGHAETPDVVEAMRRGAVDFFSKPVDRDRVVVSVKNALARRSLEGKVQALSARERRFDDEMLGASPAMDRLREEIAKVAPTQGRVLVMGESGTGKELIAQEIHRQSRRSAGPFVKVNCAAIPSELIESELFGHEKGSFSGAAARRRGQFEVAHGGTLFLDEIGDMSLSAQAKVLRALETGEVVRVGSEKALTVDVRVVAATNKDLEAEVRAGTFRDDLYFRLNVVPIVAPPLRERLEDVPLLAERFFQLAFRDNGMRPKPVEPEVYERLRQHRWPGNV